MIKLTIGQNDFYPEIIYSKRKTIGLRVKDAQSIQVKAPYFTSETTIAKLLYEKRNWIEKTLLYQKQQNNLHIREFSEEEQKKYRGLARDVLTAKACRYASLMKVHYNRISIKDQKTCWGSCSQKGNLNFNWRLVLMPEAIQDYVVVHELAHLKELNHSPAFWCQVEAVIPDYKQRRKWLREQGRYFIRTS